MTTDEIEEAECNGKVTTTANFLVLVHNPVSVRVETISPLVLVDKLYNISSLCTSNKHQ